MKFLIIGCGSIGARHICNLIEMGYKDILVYDTDKRIREAVAEKYKINACDSVGKTLDKTDMTIICTPADSHVTLALLALKKKNAVFIEKPLSTSMKGVDELQKIGGKRVMIGFNVRFHPMVKAIKNLIENIGKIYSAHLEYAYYLPDARKGNYASGYAAKKNLGGGVILDHLHEIDYGISLFGKVHSVFGSAQRISKLKIETEDTADLILQFIKGFTCTLHLDYLQRKHSRSIKIVAEKGVIEGTFTTGILKFTECDKKTVTKIFDKGFDDTYRDELQHFIRCLKKKTKPDVDVQEAIHSLRVALAIKQSIAKNKVIML